MNLKQEVRAAWVAQEIKRLWPRDGAPRAFKTERPPKAAAQQPKEQSSRAEAAQPPGRISPREG
jgi:hypothetical protein